jgi:elongator complex protein 3
MSENKFFEELVLEIDKNNVDNPKKLNNLKISLAKKHNLKRIVKNSEIIAYSKGRVREKVVNLLNIKPIRELSGVSVVALFAKPHACPHGKCIYCPGGLKSEFGDTPQSYTGAEPAALRAIRNKYDPYYQIFNRLEHYVINGRVPDKLELIFMGGTFPSLDKEYRDEFVSYVYKAVCDFGDEFFYVDDKGIKRVDFEKFNDFFEVYMDFKSKDREKKIFEKIEILKNRGVRDYKFYIKKAESSFIRPIGLTIETKPDFAMQENCLEMLEYGCTRFEIGVQSLDDDVLRKINRGHGILEIVQSFEVMKDMCFKINAHMMIGLPYSCLENDKKSLINLFEDSRFRPDMLKIYPCLVAKGTMLYDMYKKGDYKEVNTKNAAMIIAESFERFPRYVRVMRVQRDVPTPNIEAGVLNSNLRDYVDSNMQEKGIVSKDIREREIGLRMLRGFDVGEFGLNVLEYESSGGTDVFIDAVDERDSLIGFIRLRFPKNYGYVDDIQKGSALIRELHVYGSVLGVGAKAKSKNFQHKGWGKKLLEKAEEIAKDRGYNSMVVISGIGVRDYYRKFGYELGKYYMSKDL